jgi:hypothetical protein
MGIIAKCANGHVLRVKDEFAGKSGLCPHCRGRVFVPMPIRADEKARISDDEILGLLGRTERVARMSVETAESSEYVFDVRSNGGAKDETTIGASGSSVVRKAKICANCEHITSVAFTHCPRCGTSLPDRGRVTT